MENFSNCNQFADKDIVGSGLNLEINTSGCKKTMQLQLCYDLLLSKIGGISQFAKIISDGNKETDWKKVEDGCNAYNYRYNEKENISKKL